MLRNIYRSRVICLFRVDWTDIIAYPCRVVMVTMYTENRDGDVEILVQVVNPWKPDIISTGNNTTSDLYMGVILHNSTQCSQQGEKWEQIPRYEDCYVSCFYCQANFYRKLTAADLLAVTEIDSLIAEDLKDNWPVTHAVLSHHLHAAVHSLARWFVIMEQISAQQNKVNLRERKRTCIH